MVGGRGRGGESVTPNQQLFSDLEISTEPFTLEELQRAKKRIKEGKMQVEDGVSEQKTLLKKIS